MNPLFSMVTLECRFIDDSIDQKEEDNAIYSDNPGNYVSEVKIFFFQFQVFSGYGINLTQIVF